MKLQLYPKSDHGLAYTVLVTVPLAGIFTAILFYEWFGNDSRLADATLVSSYYVAGYSVLVIGWKLARLLLLRRFKYALNRLLLIVKAIIGNGLVYGSYFLIRFFFG